MKLLLIGDLHFGEQGNSPKYNQQLLNFIQWVTEKFTPDKVVQLGDWFHHRNKIQLDTLDYGVLGAKMLSDTFGKDNVFVLAGNHDIYHLNRLDISSLVAIDPYVTVIKELTHIKGSDTLLVPWVTSGEEWDKIFTHKAKYCLGHFELNGFMVNDHYTMEHGYSPKTLEKSFDLTVSGHYHSPQKQGQVQYAGTPLPITMNECNEEHGVWTLDTETGELEFHLYDQVKVISVKYHDLADIIDTLDPTATTLRVEFPDDMEDESVINDVRELLDEMKFQGSKIKYRGQKAKQLLESSSDTVSEVENIDEAVIDFLSNSSEVNGIDNDLMKTIYLRAKNLSKESHE
jgi:DNA repair exonuclease SbcCD nuclease subunit